MNGLGVLYQEGQGVAQDYAQARLWYQKAADKGNTYAKQKLSDLQQSGSATVAASSPSPVSEASPRPTSFQTAPSPTPSQADGYAEAKDYAKALPHLQKAAEAGVSSKITPRRASGTKRPPMRATQMRSKRSPAWTQSSNANGSIPGIPAWITGP
jgi:TPR repeat protein